MRIYCRQLFFAFVLFSLTIANGNAENRFVIVDNPGAASPYTNWSIAASDIHSAIDASSDGDTVFVSNGIYTVTSQVEILKGIKLESVNGPAATIIDANQSGRCVYMSHTSAAIKGFTCKNGLAEAPFTNGAGICCLAGDVIEQCIIVSNQINGNASGSGAGLYVQNMHVQDCTVAYNTISERNIDYDIAAYGAGITAFDSIVDRCDIHHNTIDLYSLPLAQGYGGGLYLENSIIRNSIVITNRIGRYSDSTAIFMGGGIYAKGSKVLNCCVLGNILYPQQRGGFGGPNGGGVYSEESNDIANCIIYYNRAPVGYAADPGLTPVFTNSVDFCNHAGDLSAFRYCCTTPTIANSWILTNDPDIVAWKYGNYCLDSSSPCIDAGVSETNVSHDYYGSLRPIDGNGDGMARYDIGAVEAHSVTGPVLELVNISIYPGSLGNEDMDYVFSVQYHSDDTNPPVYSALDINGGKYPMELAEGLPYNGTYVYSTKLPKGTNACYCLFASEIEGPVWLPESGFTNVIVFASRLTNGIVSPEQGHLGDEFEFTVEYISEEPVEPIAGLVVVDSVAYEMSLTNGNYYQGTFSKILTLDTGNHSYYFSFSNCAGILRLPLTGEYYGPDVIASNIFVSLTGSHQWPYSSWATAATNIESAIEMAMEGETIWITNGVYMLSETISIHSNIHLYGAGQIDSTILQAGHSGPCIILDSSNAIIENISIRNGFGQYGGGIRCNHGIVRSCNIYSNQSEWGGGIYLGSGSVIDCRIWDNQAQLGGGIYTTNGTVLNSLISNNIAGNGGGAYVFYNGVLEACRIFDNQATNSYVPNGGGGVYCYNGGDVSKSWIMRNAAYNGGGISAYNGGNLVNNLIVGNDSYEYGGGVYMESDCSVQSCTIVGNSAGINAGGIGIYGTYSGTLRNTIVWANDVLEQTNNYNQRTGIDAGYCCLYPAVEGSGNIAQNPLFESIASNDFRLAADSPCIDTGNDDGAPGEDIFGIPRPLDEDRDGVGFDMGCFEYCNPLSTFILNGNENSAMVFKFWALNNYLYTVQTGNNLLSEDWVCLEPYSNYPGSNIVISIPNTTPDSNLLYRFIQSQ